MVRSFTADMEIEPAVSDVTNFKWYAKYYRFKFEADVEIGDSISNVLEDDTSFQSMVLSLKKCI